MALSKEQYNYQASPEKKPEKNGIWAGDDIKVAVHGKEPQIIKPGDNHLPFSIKELKKAIPEELYDLAGLSIRSRLAQRGLDTIPDTTILLSNSLKINNSSDIINLPFVNYSQNTYILENGMGAAGLYALPGNMLTGKDLTKRMGNEIDIIGEENKDWRFTMHYINGKFTESGLELAIDKQQSRSLSDENKLLPVSGNGNSNDFRKEIDSLLVDFRENDSETVWIGQTSAHLKLLKGMYGVMKQEVGIRQHIRNTS
jgi:hypothetical protein